VDILGDAQAGTLVVPAQITVKDEGTDLTSNVSSIDFVGAGVSTTTNGNNITVNIPGLGNGGDDSTVPPDPEPDPLDPTPAPTDLTIAQLYPQDRATFEPGVSTTSPNLAPRTGSYFIKFGLTGGNFYGALNKGSGSATLYKSDGTLVSTVVASSCTVDNNVLEIPFPSRDASTDYYILIDAGYVNYCGLDSPAISTPTAWNFNTPPYDTTPFSVSGDALATVSIDIGASIGTCAHTLTITTNNNDITAGSGNMTITSPDGSTVLYSLPASSFTITNNVLTYPTDSSTLTLDDGTSYTIDIPAGWVNGPGDPCGLASGSNDAYSEVITTREAFALESYELNSGFQDYGDSTLETNVNIQSNVRLTFNQDFTVGTGSFHIYRSDGTLHQSFNVEHTFSVNGVSEIFWRTGNTIVLNPTVDMERNTSYYVLADAGTLIDVCLNNWGGISSSSDVVWTTDEGPGYTATPIDSLGATGPYGTTGSVDDSGIILNTDRDVSAGPGNIIIRAPDSTVVATIPANDSSITYGV